MVRTLIVLNACVTRVFLTIGKTPVIRGDKPAPNESKSPVLARRGVGGAIH